MARTTGLGSSRTFITQTPFYSPAFNGAVFDGPVRIYFAQSQEGLAMRLYLFLRSHAQLWKGLANRSKETHILIMVYPNSDIFELCCKTQNMQDLEGIKDASKLGVETAQMFREFRVGLDRLFAIEASALESQFERAVKDLSQQVRSLISAQPSETQLAFP